IARVRESEVPLPVGKKLDGRARIALALEEVGGASIDVAPDAGKSLDEQHERRLDIARPSQTERQKSRQALGIGFLSAADMTVRHIGMSRKRAELRGQTAQRIQA